VVVLVRDLPINASVTWPWIIGVPCGAALALTALRFREQVSGRSGWRARIGHSLRALELVLRLAGSPRRYGLAFVGIFLYWLGDISCLWAALRAFEVRTPPVAQLIIGYATGYAITRERFPWEEPGSWKHCCRLRSDGLRSPSHPRSWRSSPTG
jgi:uncharacterized membrane protein YbhN (UPF0104 family)